MTNTVPTVYCHPFSITLWGFSCTYFIIFKWTWKWPLVELLPCSVGNLLSYLTMKGKYIISFLLLYVAFSKIYVGVVDNREIWLLSECHQRLLSSFFFHVHLSCTCCDCGYFASCYFLFGLLSGFETRSGRRKALHLSGASALSFQRCLPATAQRLGGTGRRVKMQQLMFSWCNPIAEWGKHISSGSVSFTQPFSLWVQYVAQHSITPPHRPTSNRISTFAKKLNSNNINLQQPTTLFCLLICIQWQLLLFIVYCCIFY